MGRQSIHWAGSRATRADRHFHSRFRRTFDNGIFLKALPVLKDSSIVLDLGAGTGFLSIGVASHLERGSVIAVDESADMLENLSRRAKETGYERRIQARRADAAHTGLQSGSIDLVLSVYLLHEVSDPGAVLKEIARVLKPGGTFVIQDFRAGIFWRVFRRLHSGTAAGPFTVDELYASLERLGLEGIDVETRRLRYIASGRKPRGSQSRALASVEHKEAG